MALSLPVDAGPEPDAELDALLALLRGRQVVVLAGAGCSTESGIPDYRGPGSVARRAPIQYRAFVSDALARRRYWARSVVGWPRFSAARPNAAHRALADLEARGTVIGVITQNVDRLHQAAGSRAVVELHGALAEVRCLACGALEAREVLQRRLLRANPGFRVDGVELAPDGDAELQPDLVAGFCTANCACCGGMLKPNVVFFGESVPQIVVDAAYALLSKAEVLLVIGSSLAVFSGYRFVRRAAQNGVPIAIINLGATRADDLADVRVEARLGQALPRLARAL